MGITQGHHGVGSRALCPGLHPPAQPSAGYAQGSGLCREHECNGPEGRTRVRAGPSSTVNAPHGCYVDRRAQELSNLLPKPHMEPCPALPCLPPCCDA